MIATDDTTRAAPSTALPSRPALPLSELRLRDPRTSHWIETGLTRLMHCDPHVAELAQEDEQGPEHFRQLLEQMFNLGLLAAYDDGMDCGWMIWAADQGRYIRL